jgi:cobalamin biosynthesis Mg chelatase CobN
MSHDHVLSRHSRVVWMAIGLVTIALAVPSAALASSSNPSDAQYGSTSHQVAATGAGGSNGNGPSAPQAATAAGTASTDSSSTIAGLPFTGLDVGVLAVAALALLGTGVALRRLSNPARRSSS